MKKTKNIYNEPANGVLTERMNTKSPDFENFQAILLNTSTRQTKWQKINVKLTALRIQLEDYLNATDTKEIKPVGAFLKSYLDILDIKQNRFANYIGVEPSNLSKMIKGNRPINPEIALIIGKIFTLNPLLLLEVQIKNDLIKLEKSKEMKFGKYTLEGLIEENV